MFGEPQRRKLRPVCPMYCTSSPTVGRQARCTAQFVRICGTGQSNQRHRGAVLGSGPWRDSWSGAAPALYQWSPLHPMRKRQAVKTSREKHAVPATAGTAWTHRSSGYQGSAEMTKNCQRLRTGFIIIAGRYGIRGDRCNPTLTIGSYSAVHTARMCIRCWGSGPRRRRRVVRDDGLFLGLRHRHAAQPSRRAPRDLGRR